MIHCFFFIITGDQGKCRFHHLLIPSPLSNHLPVSICLLLICYFRCWRRTVIISGLFSCYIGAWGIGLLDAPGVLSVAFIPGLTTERCPDSLWCQHMMTNSFLPLISVQLGMALKDLWSTLKQKRHSLVFLSGFIFTICPNCTMKAPHLLTLDEGGYFADSYSLIRSWPFVIPL